MNTTTDTWIWHQGTGTLIDGDEATLLPKEEYGICDICDGPYLLGSDDHDAETGNHQECQG